MKGILIYWLISLLFPKLICNNKDKNHLLFTREEFGKIILLVL